MGLIVQQFCYTCIATEAWECNSLYQYHWTVISLLHLPNTQFNPSCSCEILSSHWVQPNDNIQSCDAFVAHFCTATNIYWMSYWKSLACAQKMQEGTWVWHAAMGLSYSITEEESQEGTSWLRDPGGNSRNREPFFPEKNGCLPQVQGSSIQTVTARPSREVTQGSVAINFVRPRPRLRPTWTLTCQRKGVPNYRGLKRSRGTRHQS